MREAFNENDPEAHREWKAAKSEACSTPEGRVKWRKDNCTCWKKEMEDALHG